MPKLPQWATVTIEIFCLAIILAFSYMRNQYREHDVSSKKSWIAQIVLSAISILDIVVCFVLTGQKYNYPWVAAMIRPFYLVISIRVLREYAKRYFLVIKDSTPMVLFIVVYILYFAWMGQRLFSGTLEGVQYFDTFGNSVFNMLVLMTTSNFPDIMLPAYQRDRVACLYFIIYLLVGLFLMMNLLLAIFYSNFKFRFEQNIGNSEEKRSDYLFTQFEKYGGKKGYLTNQETYKLFMVIHGLATLTD